MNQIVKVEIAVDALAAEALKDTARRERVERLVSRVALLYQGHDELADTLERTSQQAQAAGLSDADIDAELAAYNAERRS